MTQEQIKEWVFRVLAGLVLLAFVWLYGADLLKALFGGKVPFLEKPSPAPAAEQLENPRVYVMTAVATLVGGVAAVFLGVEGAKNRLAGDGLSAADKIRVAYVLVYVLFGTAAIVAWVKNGQNTPRELRTLAVTFIGLVSPAVAAYVAPKPGS